MAEEYALCSVYKFRNHQYSQRQVMATCHSPMRHDVRLEDYSLQSKHWGSKRNSNENNPWVRTKDNCTTFRKMGTDIYRCLETTPLCIRGYLKVCYGEWRITLSDGMLSSSFGDFTRWEKTAGNHYQSVEVNFKVLWNIRQVEHTCMK